MRRRKAGRADPAAPLHRWHTGSALTQRQADNASGRPPAAPAASLAWALLTLTLSSNAAAQAEPGRLREARQRGGGVWPVHLPTRFSNGTTDAEAAWCNAAFCAPLTAAALPWQVPRDVRHGVVVESLEQFRPMVARLHAGRPVQALIYGSSLTQWQVRARAGNLLIMLSSSRRLNERLGDPKQGVAPQQPRKPRAPATWVCPWATQAGCFHTGPASGVASKVGAKGAPSWSNLYRDDLPLEMPYTSCLTYDAHGVSWCDSGPLS